MSHSSAPSADAVVPVASGRPAVDPVSGTDRASGTDPAGSPGAGPSGSAPVPAAGVPVGVASWSPRRWLLTAAGLLASLVLAAVIIGTSIVDHAEAPFFLDLRIYLGAAQTYVDGYSIYTYTDPWIGLGSTYPPIASILFVPMTRFTPVAADYVWIAINVACIVGSGWLIVRRHLRLTAAEAWIYALLALGPVLFMRPAFKTVDIGQINLVLWTVVLVDVFAVARGRRWGGVGVGLAAAVKLVPALFVLLYVVAGRWAAAVRAAATFVALGVLAWILDPADSREYWTKLVWDASRIGPVADAQNNSLRFVLAQTSLPERAQLAVWAVAVLALGVVGLWRAGQAWRRGSVLYAAVITGCVAALASPISWTHHLVFLPLIILFLPRTRWPVLGGALVAVAVVFFWDPYGQGYDVVTASLRALCMVAVVVGLLGTDDPDAMLFRPRGPADPPPLRVAADRRWRGRLGRRPAAAPRTSAVAPLSADAVRRATPTRRATA